MELPADPGKILYGIYNRYGVDITKVRDREQSYIHHIFENDVIDDGNDIYGMDFSNLY